jgi:hypothetical protein
MLLTWIRIFIKGFVFVFLLITLTIFSLNSIKSHVILYRV